MPKLSDAARVTTADGAVWRTCVGCGVLTALAPAVDLCGICTPVDGAGFSREQVDGFACITCGAEAVPGLAMVPAGFVPGWGQVFACATHDETPAAGWRR